MLTDPLKAEIEKDLRDNPVLVYMKGNPEMPQCGFSAQVIRVLDHFGAKYATRDILQNEDLRQGIKEYSDWPTLPQVYIKGEFIGGCDIVTEMAQNGELQKLLETVKEE